MNRWFAYIKTIAFRKQLLFSFLAFVAILLLANVLLRYYTRHGEGQKVPNFKGLGFEKAKKIAEEQGLRYATDSVYIPDKTAGIVVEQDPDPFTLVKPNRIIYLTVTTSKKPNIKMPDIENLDLSEALVILENYELKLGDTTYRSDIAKNVVLEVRMGEQVIEKGSDLAKGSRVDLVLGDGLGANEVPVPNMLGMNIKQAIESIKKASLSPGKISYTGLGDSLKANVSAQKPEPSDSVTKVSIGTRVDLVLSDD